MYQGEEIVSHWDSTGESVLMSDIWHVSGGQTVTRTLASGTAASGQPYTSSDTDGQRPEGVLGVTTQLVQLLDPHHQGDQRRLRLDPHPRLSRPHRGVPGARSPEPPVGRHYLLSASL